MAAVQSLPGAGPGAEAGGPSSAGGGSGANGRSNDSGRYLVKLAESPFYAPGGGQVADVGTIECESGDCRARVEDVFRVGDDQALSVVLERGTLAEGESVLARVDTGARRATECNHTATHLLQAALRRVLGTHVRQAGSYVGPDKLRFDFSHGAALSQEELRDVEGLVNEWIYRNDPVRPITTTLDEARKLGAMALFGEKYGDIVRMVQIGEGEYSRELCGGTHVRSTAEIGAFRIISETSSSANVRRIEALSGPPAVEQLRAHDGLLAEIVSRASLAAGGRPRGAARGAQEPARSSSAPPARGRRRAGRTSSSCWPEPRISTAHGCCWPAPRRPTRSPCSSYSTRQRAASATESSCWPPPARGV